jgi:phenylpropionate dioxygenase-like ring-hydroxylating dioxygenase large terminal subunit
MTHDGWFVALPAAELVLGEIAWVQLDGEELAVWRDASGGVNAWENRCPHRGVRLTLGDNLGSELRCRYHGWRFAFGSGTCTTIPARPEHVPPGALGAKTYACREAFGFVWVNLAGPDGSAAAASEPSLPLDADRVTTARSVVVHASRAHVAAALPAVDGIVYALAPMNDSATVVHAAFSRVLAGDERVTALREHDRRIRDVRDHLERNVVAS